MVVTGAAFCTSDLAQPFTRRPTHIDYGGIFRRSTPRSRRSFCETLKTLAEVSSGTREEWLSDRLTDWYSRQVTTCREYQSISGQLTTSSTGGHLLLYLRCISAASKMQSMTLVSFASFYGHVVDAILSWIVHPVHSVLGISYKDTCRCLMTSI